MKILLTTLGILLVLTTEALAATCNPGYYKSGGNCVACSPGTFSNTTNASSCTACPDRADSAALGTSLVLSMPVRTGI